MSRSWAAGALAAVVAVGVLAAPAAAMAPTSTQTASAGDVTASFSYSATGSGIYANKNLTISRAGRTVYDQPVTSSYCGPPTAQQYCAPGFGKAVHVVALEPGGEPNVVLDLYTGGAHCCSIEQVFSWNAGTGTYDVSQHNFGDPGERIVTLSGRHEFLTADDTFAYAFTDYADSGLPLRILSFSGGRFVNVTRRYPKLIARDAARYLKAFKHDLGNGDGLIAAWAADEDNLGHQSLVASTLAHYFRAGDLRSLDYPKPRRFLIALSKLLRKDGYVH